MTADANNVYADSNRPLCSQPQGSVNTSFNCSTTSLYLDEQGFIFNNRAPQVPLSQAKPI
jgi:hypothetical protein